MIVLAVDPGPVKSAYVIFEEYVINRYGKIPNHDLRHLIIALDFDVDYFVIEEIGHYGLPVGRDVFQTSFWSGRFFDVWTREAWAFLISRGEVKLHLCGQARAKDANVRQAVIDKYGGDIKAIGGKKCKRCKGKAWTGRGHDPCTECDDGWESRKGPLYGITADVWQALALAITFSETNEQKEIP